MLHSMELVVKVVRDPRSSASHAHTRAALVTVATTVLATRLLASALVHVKALHQARRPSALSTATTRIGGRSSTLLGASSAERTTLLLGSSGVTATLCTASRWPNAAKCNAVYGTNANG